MSWIIKAKDKPEISLNEDDADKSIKDLVGDIAENMGKPPTKVSLKLKMKCNEEENQLDMGINVEKEHSDTIRWMAEKLGGRADNDMIEEVAKRIAQDHLKELPDYYTRLKAMEAKE